MDKKTLLYKIAQQETSRLKNLSINNLKREVSEWFNDEILEYESGEDIISDYIEDYMRYREDETVEELQKLIK